MPVFDPHMLMGGGNLAAVILGLIVLYVVYLYLSDVLLPLLALVADWAGITVLVFLRADMGVRTVSLKRILVGTIFLYLVGNMIGHNYHDFYRNRTLTIAGAVVHFTFLILFLVMALYRRFRAGQLEDRIRPSFPGVNSKLAKLCPTYRILPDSRFYQSVVVTPLTVILAGLVAVELQNWFGWYLVLTGCLLFYKLIYERYWEREARLNALNMSEPQND
jgi:hypothetical protein